ncbi:M16 family metallopeptidase [Vreelandella sulfidaeris]|uniref:M16 family metallopeptidase n=1 Tax=Vreelandella sulfidaeris TaxID=115553 RepID=UPI0035EE551A
MPTSPYTLAALKGGAQGLFHTRQSTPLVHIIIVVGAGYLDEPESTPGLAHLLEHVLLTQPVVQGSSLLALTEQLGGKLNARTDDLITDIHASLPAGSLSQFLTYLHQTLFAPRFDEATIASESTAIDAEYQARLGTSAMRRLAGLQTLAEATHPGAFCHHGSRRSLGRPPETLKDELKHFHRRYYTPSRISVGLSAPLPQVQQQALLDAILPGDYPSTPPDTKPLSRRWRPTSQPVEIEGAASSVELLWPLAAAGLAHNMDVLKASEQALNAGALTQLLDGLADDYEATLCPSGATDTLAVTVHLPADQQRELLTRSAGITQVINRVLEAHTDRALVTVDRPSLAEWLFTQTRQQALAQRFGATGSEISGPGLLATQAAYALLTAPANATAHKMAPQNHAMPPANVISKVGDGGGTGLPPHWLACFYPDRKIALPALAQKRLAAQGIGLLQHTTAHGSWLCAHGAQPLANALSEVMQKAWLTPLPELTGLQAHRLLAELTPSPTRPLLWTDSTEAAHALSPLLAALPEVPTPHAAEGPATPSQRVTLMRTLTLPGSAIHRQLMAIAAKRHSAPFFQAMRQTHQLGYIAAVRFIDGDPASVAYIVQCPQADITQVKLLIQEEIDRLWAQLLTNLAAEWPLPHEEFTGLDIPETPTAVLIAHWQAHLNASHTPLYRLSRPAPSSFLVDDWRRWVADPDLWAWRQRAG